MSSHALRVTVNGRPALSALCAAAGLAAIWSCGASPACASTGAVVGHVIDEKGQPFAFAPVFLENEAGTTRDQRALSGEDGFFRFAPVVVGRYRLYAHASGRTSTKWSGIAVQIGRTHRHEIVMYPAEGPTQTVTVRGGDVVDETETGAGTTLDQDFVDELPISTTSLESTAALMPTVIKTGSSESDEISIAGGTSEQIGYEVDGGSINSSLKGGKGLNLPSAGVAGVALATGGAKANKGKQASGTIEAVTRSGSNEVSFNLETSTRSVEYGAAKLDGLDEVARFWNDGLLGKGTLLEKTLEDGFALLGVSPVSTLGDDQNPVPLTKTKISVATGGPIEKDVLFFHVAAESARTDRGSAFGEGIDHEDRILLQAKLDWRHGKANTTAFSFNLDHAEESGHSSILRAPSTATRRNAGTLRAALKDTRVLGARRFVENGVEFMKQQESVRPSDRRGGLGTRYSILIPPGGWVAHSLGGAGVDQDDSVSTLRLRSSLNSVLGSRGQHDVEVGGDWEGTWFELTRERGVEVTDFRVVDDRQLDAQDAFIGREVAFGPRLRTRDSSWAASLYALDTWRMSPSLTVDVGVRADYQSFVGELFISPRLAFALAPIPGSGTRFFGNWGLYTNNLFAEALQWSARPDRISSDLIFFPQESSRTFDEKSIVELHDAAVATPRTSAAPDAVAFRRPVFHDRHVLDTNLTAPVARDWTVGAERRLPGDVRVQASYREIRRSHELERFFVTKVEPEFEGVPTVREWVSTSTGIARYRHWAVELQRPFQPGSRWSLNASYTQSRSSGPLGVAREDVDLTRASGESGVLGNDRTHVVKAQALYRLPQELMLSSVFTWQTGLPLSALLIGSDGSVDLPLGQNTLRLPSSRQWDVGLSRRTSLPGSDWKVSVDLQVFNLLNELNAFGGEGRFKLPEGAADPLTSPPLRPDVLPSRVDVPRSVQFRFGLSF